MNQDHQEYITLKDIFLKIGEYYRYTLHKWFWIGTIGIFIGLIIAYKYHKSPTLYKESLTFMMDETQAESTIPGLDVLGSIFGGNGKQNNLGKILQLFETRKIIHSTLMDTVVINGKNDFLANHILDIYSIPYLAENYCMLGLFYKKGWIKKVLENPNFRFSHPNVDKFTPTENLYLRLLYEQIAGNKNVGISPMLSSKMDEQTGIMVLNMVSESEDITIQVLDIIYKKLSNFFIEKSIEKESKTYNLMKEKRDSIFRKLTGAEYALADFKDSHRNLITVKGLLKKIQLERQVSILNSMYHTVVRQMDASEFALKNKTPIVQVIDLPRRPIEPDDPNWLVGLIKGGLMGVVLGIFFFLIKKIFSDIMA